MRVSLRIESIVHGGCFPSCPARRSSATAAAPGCTADPGGAWGFAGEQGIVPVEQCALFEEPLQELADALRGIELPGVKDLGLDTSATGKGAVDLRGKVTPALRKRAEELLGLVGGVTLESGESLADPVLVDAYPGFRLRSRPDVFSQANRWMVPALQEAALLDPPRTGAADAVRALAKLGIPRVAYVSCDAPTLARDAKLLWQAGYRLISAQPLDLFPQTARFEVVAAFALRDGISRPDRGSRDETEARKEEKEWAQRVSASHAERGVRV